MRKPGNPNTVGRVLRRSSFWFVGLFAVSGLINLLTLTGSIYMLQVYDRVLGSQSVPTLISLSAFAAGAFMFQGWLEGKRSRALALIGEQIEVDIGPLVNEAAILAGGGSAAPAEVFKHLDAVRGFFCGPGIVALFDIPWIPIYVIAVFVLHSWLGWLVVGGAAFAFVLALVAEVRGRRPTRTAIEAQMQRNALTTTAASSADAVRAMGMLPALTARWTELQARTAVAQRRTAFVGISSMTWAKTFRTLLQSAVLGLGAYLAIKGQMSAGAIIAASILSTRALAPVDQAIGSWKNFVAARHGYARLHQLLGAGTAKQARFDLPQPSKSLSVQGVTVVAPATRKVLVHQVRFDLAAGDVLGVIGPTGSGKTTLGRALVRACPIDGGSIKLDGADLWQWTQEKLGQSVGYLPQDVQLLDGTIGDNISRFDTAPDVTEIQAAAISAGVDLIIKDLGGYDVRIGSGGILLAGGQRQRIGLARALYKSPFLVVLDEPNAHLDREGELAVMRAILEVKARGGIAVVIAHRPSIIEVMDKILEMRAGHAKFGPRDEMLVGRLPGLNVGAGPRLLNVQTKSQD